MTAEDILDVLTDIFRDCFGDPALVLEERTSARDIADWDSGKMVHLIIVVEDRFGITMKSREIDALRNVGDWVKLLQGRHVRG
jgi:acyl carrier protein